MSLTTYTFPSQHIFSSGKFEKLPQCKSLAEPRSADPVPHVLTHNPSPSACIHTTAIVKDVQVYTGRIIPNRNPVTSFGNPINPYQNDPIVWGTVRAPCCSIGAPLARRPSFLSHHTASPPPPISLFHPPQEITLEYSKLYNDWTLL